VVYNFIKILNKTYLSIVLIHKLSKMSIKAKSKEFRRNNKHLFKRQDLNSTIFKRIFRWTGILIARPLAKYTKITPNQITYIGLLLFAIAGYFLYLGTYYYLIWAGIIILVATLLDYVDGTLARIKSMSSDFGTWLDHTFGAFSYIFVFFGAAFGIYNRTGNFLALVFAFLSISSVLMRSLIHETYIGLFPFAKDIIEKEKIRKKFLKNFALQTPIAQLIIVLGAFFNQMYLVLVFFAIYGWIYCIGLYLFLSIKVKKYKQ